MTIRKITGATSGVVVSATTTRSGIVKATSRTLSGIQRLENLSSILIPKIAGKVTETINKLSYDPEGQGFRKGRDYFSALDGRSLFINKAQADEQLTLDQIILYLVTGRTFFDTLSFSDVIRLTLNEGGITKRDFIDAVFAGDFAQVVQLLAPYRDTITTSDQRPRFFINKSFGDITQMIDLAGVFDGITYNYGLSRTDSQTVLDSLRSSTFYIRTARDGFNDYTTAGTVIKNVFPQPLNITNWFNSTSSGVNQCTVTADTTQALSPAGGIPMMMYNMGPDPYINTYAAPKYNLAPATSGQTWTASVWVKSNLPNVTGQIFIFGANPSGIWAGGYEITAVTFSATQSSWTRVSATRTFTSSNTAYIQARLDGPDTSQTGTVLWFDGFQVERGSTATSLQRRDRHDNDVNERITFTDLKRLQDAFTETDQTAFKNLLAKSDTATSVDIKSLLVNKSLADTTTMIDAFSFGDNFTYTEIKTVADLLSETDSKSFAVQKTVKQGIGTHYVRGNLYTSSNTFSYAGYNRYISSNAVLAPDGTTTASVFIESADAVATYHGAGIRLDATLFAGVRYTASVYAKSYSSDRNFIMGFGGNWVGSGNYAYGLYNPQTGVGGLFLSSGGSPSATMTAVGNGWYRCTLSFTPSLSFPTSTATNIDIQLHNGSGNFFQGNGTSGVILWGAQLETGSYANSYIPSIGLTSSTALYYSNTPASTDVIFIGTDQGFKTSYNTFESTPFLINKSVVPDLITESDLSILQPGIGKFDTVIESDYRYFYVNKTNRDSVTETDYRYQFVNKTAKQGGTDNGKVLILRGNTLLWSEDFSNGIWNWTGGVSSFSSTATIAPDGTLTASKITLAGTANPQIGQYAAELLGYNNSVYDGITFTASVWAWTDPGQPTDFKILLCNGAVNQVGQTSITLTTTPTRYQFTWQMPNNAGGGVWLQLKPPANPVAGNYIYLWGAQVEEAATLGDYYKTTSPTVINLINTDASTDIVSVGKNLGVKVSGSVFESTPFLITKSRQDTVSESDSRYFFDNKVLRDTPTPVDYRYFTALKLLTDSEVIADRPYKWFNRSVTSPALTTIDRRTLYAIKRFYDTVNAAEDQTTLSDGFAVIDVLSRYDTANIAEYLARRVQFYRWPWQGFAENYTVPDRTFKQFNLAAKVGSYVNVPLFRTNLVTYSEQFDYWTPHNVTVTNIDGATIPQGVVRVASYDADQVSGILAYNNGYYLKNWYSLVPPSQKLEISSPDLIIEDTSTGLHRVTSQTITAVAGMQYAMGVYLKYSGRTFVGIGLDTGSTKAIFNLQTGAVASSTAVLSANVQPVGQDGWYLCTITGTLPASSVSFTLRTFDDNLIANYTGDGVSGYYAWGAQFEADTNIQEISSLTYIGTQSTPRSIIGYNLMPDDRERVFAGTMNRYNSTRLSNDPYENFSYIIAAKKYETIVAGNAVTGIRRSGDTLENINFWAAKPFADAETITDRFIIGLAFNKTYDDSVIESDAKYLWFNKTAKQDKLVNKVDGNYIIASEDFANLSYWSTNAGGATSNVITAPNGAVTADKLFEYAGTSLHGVTAVGTAGITEGLPYTISVYVKSAGQSRNLQIVGPTGAGSASAEVPVFNPDTGVVTLPATSSFVKSAYMYPVGSGWYRCVMSGISAIIAGGLGYATFALTTSTATTVPNYAGTYGTGVYIWGAQVTAWPVETDYVPTTISPVIIDAIYADDRDRVRVGSFNKGFRTAYDPLERISFLISRAGSNSLSDLTTEADATRFTILRAGSNSLTDSVTEPDRDVYWFNLTAKQGVLNAVSGTTVTAPSIERVFVGQQYGAIRFASDPLERIAFLLQAGSVPFDDFPAASDARRFWVNKLFGDETPIIDAFSFGDNLTYLYLQRESDSFQAGNAVLGLRRSGDTLENLSFIKLQDTKAGLTYAVSGTTVTANDRDRLFVGQQYGSTRLSGDPLEKIAFLLQAGSVPFDDFPVVGLPFGSRVSGDLTENTKFTILRAGSNSLSDAVIPGLSLGFRVSGTNSERVSFLDLKSAKASTNYTITGYRDSGTPNVTFTSVTITAADIDRLIAFDDFQAAFASGRSLSDLVIAGSDTGFRLYGNNLETTKFFINKYFGDTTPALDLVGIGDGLNYYWIDQEADAVTAGNGVTGVRRSGDTLENTKYLLLQTAKQGIGTLRMDGNILPFSEDFTTSTHWGLGNAAVVGNAIAAPNGTLTADKLNETAVSGSHYIVSSANGLVGSSYTLSVYIKSAGQARYLQIAGMGLANANEAIVFNPDNGTFQLPATSSILKAAGMYSVGNGWYRCWIHVGGPNFLNNSPWLSLATSTTVTAGQSYLGVAGTGLYIWGAQMVAWPTLTNYVGPTTATAVTGFTWIGVAGPANTQSDTDRVLIGNGVSSIRAAGDVLENVSFLLQAASVPFKDTSVAGLPGYGIRVSGSPLENTKFTSLLVAKQGGTTSGKTFITRGNTLFWSEDFSNGSWNWTGGVQITSNSVLAPNGTLTANKINLTGAINPQVGQYAAETIGFNNNVYEGVTFTASVWAWTDAGQPTDFKIFLCNGAVTQFGQTSITLTTTPTRYQFTYKMPDGAGSGVWVQFRPPAAPVAGNYIYMWGGQVEEADFAGDYTPTTSTVVVYNTNTNTNSDVVFAGKNIGVKVNGSVLETTPFLINKSAKQGAVKTVSGTTVTAPSGDSLFVGQQYGNTRFSGDPLENWSFWKNKLIGDTATMLDSFSFGDNLLYTELKSLSDSTQAGNNVLGRRRSGDPLENLSWLMLKSAYSTGYAPGNEIPSSEDFMTWQTSINVTNRINDLYIFNPTTTPFTEYYGSGYVNAPADFISFGGVDADFSSALFKNTTSAAILNLTSSSLVSVSFFVRRIARATGMALVIRSGFTTSQAMEVSFNAASTPLGGAFVTGDLVNRSELYTSVNYGNGWIRNTVFFQPGPNWPAQSGLTVGIKSYNATPGSQDQIALWGFQVTVNTPGTHYIQTTSAAVTVLVKNPSTTEELSAGDRPSLMPQLRPIFDNPWDPSFKGTTDINIVYNQGFIRNTNYVNLDYIADDYVGDSRVITY